MTLEEFDLYGGLTGAELPVDHFDFGRGISVSRTFAHLMAPFMMAFGRPEPGNPHPAPWCAAKGGFGFDVIAQIHVPKEFHERGWFDHLNTVWWFVALLRFRATPHVHVPVVASGPFADGPKTEDILFWPMEIEPRQLRGEPQSKREIDLEDLEWIRHNWHGAGKLMHQSGEFNLLFQACTGCVFARNPALALLSLWGTLEGVFSPAKVELRFRISANLASFLEPPGKGRLELQKKVAKMYDVRSVAAHGGSEMPSDALADAYALTKRVLTKVIEENHVPTREELEDAMFGV